MHQIIALQLSQDGGIYTGSKTSRIEIAWSLKLYVLVAVQHFL